MGIRVVEVPTTFVYFCLLSLGGDPPLCPLWTCSFFLSIMSGIPWHLWNSCRGGRHVDVNVENTDTFRCSATDLFVALVDEGVRASRSPSPSPSFLAHVDSQRFVLLLLLMALPPPSLMPPLAHCESRHTPSQDRLQLGCQGGPHFTMFSSQVSVPLRSL